MAEKAGGAGAAHDAKVSTDGPAGAPDDRAQRIASLVAKVKRQEEHLKGAKDALAAERAAQKGSD
jgi:hypothetical protein